MTEVCKVIHFLWIRLYGKYYSHLDSSSPCILQTAASKKWLKTTSRLRSSSGAHGKYSPHYSKFYQFCPDGPPYIWQKMKAPRSCFEAIKLIVRHGPLYPGACRKSTLRGVTDAPHFPDSRPAFVIIIITIGYPPVHAQIKFQGRLIERRWRDRSGPCQGSHHPVIFIDVKILCRTWIL